MKESNDNPSTKYRGRFAPSPTGELHIGSLIAALASYVDAKAHNGFWYVRIEDIDPPREIPGATDSILRTLERFGFEWDGPVVYQHQRLDVYRTVIQSLIKQQHAYFCHCSRKDLEHVPHRTNVGVIYPGYCRNRNLVDNERFSVRVRVDQQNIFFVDNVQGTISNQLDRDSGDYIIRRADGLIAYQLAVVVDDAQQGITDIVRGSDLLELTPRQIHLRQLLGLPRPNYLHIPVIANELGEKLSKQTGAKPVHDTIPEKAIFYALEFLGQNPPADLKTCSSFEILRWAIANWDRQKIPRLLNKIGPEIARS